MSKSKMPSMSDDNYDYDDESDDDSNEGYEDGYYGMQDDEDEDALEQAEKNLYAWYTYFAINYDRADQDKQFTLLTQWTAAETDSIRMLGLPLMQFNKLYDFCKKVIGEARNITPQLQIRSKKYVSPQEDGENIQIQKSINILQNFIRGIAYDSNSQLAYQTAFANTIYMGFGAIHVKYDYEDSKSFNCKISIAGLDTPEKAFFDPSAVEPSKCDGEFCGVYYDVDRRTFKKLYPDVDYPSSFPSQVPQYFTWDTTDTITVIDYYCKHWYKKNLVLLDNGDTLEEKDYEKFVELLEEANEPIPGIADRRVADDYKIIHYKMIKGQILEKSEHPSKLLPVIFVDGDSFKWRGLQYTQSFVKHAIDAQRFLNYTGIAIAQGLKNSRKEQFIGTPENIRGYEDVWKKPELMQGLLLANFDSKAGMPQKLPASEISQSLYQNYERAEMDIQSILGLYNANLGAPTQETSGIAINAKKQQGQFAAAVYRDNLIRAIEQTGRVVLSMIPVVYDTEREVSLLNSDGTSSTVQINQKLPDGTIKNDITGDYYDIAIEAGASYEDQKTASLELLVKLVQTNPQVFPYVADLIADNLDIENRNQLVERLRSLVPPDILAKEKGEPLQSENQQPSPEMLMQQQQAQMQQAQLQMQQAQIQNESKKIDLQQEEIELKHKEQEIEMIKLGAEHNIETENARIKALQVLAEMYRTGVDLKGNDAQILSKLLDIHKSKI